MKRTLVICCLGIGASAFSAPVTHCTPGEQIVFSCTSAQKIVSVCAAPKNAAKDYMAYRFSSSNKPPFIWSADEEHPARRFHRTSLSGASSASTVLWFENQEYVYAVSEPVKGIPSLVVSKAGKEISRIACTGNMTIDLATDRPYVTEARVRSGDPTLRN